MISSVRMILAQNISEINSALCKTPLTTNLQHRKICDALSLLTSSFRNNNNNNNNNNNARLRLCLRQFSQQQSQSPNPITNNRPGVQWKSAKRQRDHQIRWDKKWPTHCPCWMEAWLGERGWPWKDKNKISKKWGTLCIISQAHYGYYDSTMIIYIYVYYVALYI